MSPTTFQLPGGYVDEYGVVQRDITLSPLSGREEELLADRGRRSSASLVTAIISRCIHRIGDISPVSEDFARNLLVADRQYLLIQLRNCTFGTKVQDTVYCPWPGCGERVDIDFSIEDIPIQESTDKGPYYKMQLSPEAVFEGEDGQACEGVVFRLPNGGDQEALSALIADNEALALTRLLQRCILQIGPFDPADDQIIAGLSPRARFEIEKKMDAVAPKVELTMGAVCPECSRKFTLPFDLQDFFFGELRISQDLLLREVHYLAYHYHWSEMEIMQMPRDKRRKYIEVLTDEIEQLNNAIG